MGFIKLLKMLMLFVKITVNMLIPTCVHHLVSTVRKTTELNQSKCNERGLIDLFLCHVDICVLLTYGRHQGTFRKRRQASHDADPPILKALPKH